MVAPEQEVFYTFNEICVRYSEWMDDDRNESLKVTISQDMINKMDEWRKWKTIYNKEGRTIEDWGTNFNEPQTSQKGVSGEHIT